MKTGGAAFTGVCVCVCYNALVEKAAENAETSLAGKGKTAECEIVQ